MKHNYALHSITFTTEIMLVVESFGRLPTAKSLHIRRTKSQILTHARLALQLSLSNSLEPGVKSRMKM